MDTIVRDLKLTGESYQVVKQRTRDNLEAKRRDLGVMHLDLLPDEIQQKKLFDHYKHYNTNYTKVMDTVCRHTEWSYDQVKAVVANLYRQLVQPEFAGVEFRPVAVVAYNRTLNKVRAQLEHQPCIR